MSLGLSWPKNMFLIIFPNKKIIAGCITGSLHFQMPK
jgi:hypothetical protein